ncbi:MAG: hypothetical protein M3N24_00805 [Actinomycetota bacterium]|nr:hypothetical protein [Actinomycetota bacterium]
MNVVFIAPEEPIYLPTFFRRVLPTIREKVRAVVVVPPIYTNSSFLSQAKRFISVFGLWEFLVEGIRVMSAKIFDFLSRVTRQGHPRSVRGLATRFGIPTLTPKNVNDPKFLKQLQRLDPDLIISVSSPQIFQADLISIPKRGCLNLHSALLPQYRGVLPTFWAMLNGEKETGVTLHVVSPRIDEGPILLQKRVSIEASDSLDTLIHKCKYAGADLVLEAIAGFESDEITPSVQDTRDGSYFSFPTRADVERFKAMGRSLR